MTVNVHPRYLFSAAAWVLAIVSCGDSERDLHRDSGRGGGASGAPGVDAAAGALAGGAAGSWAGEAGKGGDTGGMGGSPDIDGNSGASGYPGAVPSDEVGAVQGRVIDLYRKVPLGGRTVMVGDRSTVTAADGSFAITGATDVSDIGVLDADRSNLSIYRGLSVRDNLILAHPVTEATERQPHFGRVEGNLSGGAEYPLTAWNDIVVAYFFSERLRDSLVIGGGSNRSGPKYAMMLGFNGEERLEGVLFALGTFTPDPAQEGRARYSAAVAEKNIVITNGVTENIDLHLEPVDLGVVMTSVVAPDALADLFVFPYYRFPFPDGLVTLPNADVLRETPTADRREFTFDVPKLVESGGTLCLRATVEAHPRRHTEVCGVELDGEPMLIELDATPVLSNPSSGETVNGALEYVWTEPANGISMLELTPDSEPSSAQPTIRVFTVESSAVIDGAAWGLTRRSGARYGVRVATLGPFDSLDQAASPEGWGTLVPAETRMSYSGTATVTTVP